MPILGRQLGGQADDGILRDVNLDSSIVSNDLRRMVLFNSTSNYFELLTSVDTRYISSAIFGMLIRIDTVTNKGDVQLTGYATYPGAIVGQTYYLETDGTNRSGPPDTGLWVRIGYCTKSNSLNLAIDIEQPSGLFDQVVTSTSDLNLLDASEYKRMFVLVQNPSNSDENGIYQSIETSSNVWEWVQVLSTSSTNVFTHSFLTRRN